MTTKEERIVELLKAIIRNQDKSIEILKRTVIAYENRMSVYDCEHGVLGEKE